MAKPKPTVEQNPALTESYNINSQDIFEIQLPGSSHSPEWSEQMYHAALASTEYLRQGHFPFGELMQSPHAARVYAYRLSEEKIEVGDNALKYIAEQTKGKTMETTLKSLCDPSRSCT